MADEKNTPEQGTNGLPFIPGFDTLHKIFTNVNDWLKFAEAKNLMLITFNAASIYGTSKIFDGSWTANYPWVKYVAFVSIVLFVFSAVVCVMSFIPSVKILKGGEFTSNREKNIWFYETLKEMDNVKVLQELYGSTATSFSRAEEDLAEQVIQNSKIASRKYAYFTVAAWLAISGYVTIVLAALYFGFNYVNNDVQKP
jgi:hypothetical protein